MNVLYLQSLTKNALKGERIIINQTESPDGAEGAFLLLKKERFNWGKYCGDEVKSLLTHLHQKEKKFFNVPNNERIQDFFENFAYDRLIKILGEENVKRVCREHMNKYDFIVFLKNRNILLEIKSDKWPNTGNVALEIIRECRKYKNNIEEMETNKFNVGSIIKTRADYWIVYYYDYKNYNYFSHIYWIPEVKKIFFDILINSYKKLFKGDR